MTSESEPRILIVGCGGIGGIMAATLIHHGHDVTVLTRNQAIAAAIEEHGLRTCGAGSVGTIAARAATALEPRLAPYDVVLLATQPTEVEEAARQVLPWLADRGVMVCLQNGLCEPRVAAIAGSERVVGAVVAWGASMTEPGLYDRTSAGGFVLGRTHAAPPFQRSVERSIELGRADQALTRLAQLFELVGPVAVSDNLLGARWSKLAINCVISSLGTVGGDRLGGLLRKRYVRRLGLEIMTEAVAVARAEGVRLEKVSGTLDLDWIALTESEKRAGLGSASLVVKHSLLLAVGARYRRLRSSMLAAIERGRTPAIDFLNGEVVTRGRDHGIATPINAEVVRTVKRIARGEVGPSHDTLRALFERTRKPSPQPDSPPSPKVRGAGGVKVQHPPRPQA
jgi:2-dehydropantoate 2-reductase